MRLRQLRLCVRLALGLVLPLLACAEPSPAPEGKPTVGPRSEGLRTSGEVSEALGRADRAYLAGEWGEAVVQANRVIEGAASPEDYYAAVKILGLASCNRRDPRPAAFAYKRLQPADREHLRGVCQQAGVVLAEQP